MKTLNILIQNSKGNTLAELNLSFTYGGYIITDIIESLTLKGYAFYPATRADLLEWVGRTITNLESGDVLVSTYKLKIDSGDARRVITMSITTMSVDGE